MIVFSTCHSGVSLQTKLNTPATMFSLMKKSTVVVTMIAHRAAEPPHNSDFYTAKCRLKSDRERWLASIYNRRWRERSWFVDSGGFVQSLILLICSGLCVVLSGIVLAFLFSLSLSKLHKACLLTVRFTLVSLDAPDSPLPSRSVFSNSDRQCDIVGLPILSEEGVFQNVFMDVMDIILVITSLLLLKSGDVELNPGPIERNGVSSQLSPNENARVEEPGPQPSESMAAEKTASVSSSDKAYSTVSPNSDSQDIMIPKSASDSPDTVSGGIRKLHIASPLSSSNPMTQNPTRSFSQQVSNDLGQEHSQVEVDLQPKEYVAYGLGDPQYINKVVYTEGLQELPDFFEVEHRYENREDFAKDVNKELDSLTGLQESFAKSDLDECTKNFFHHANRLYRAGCKCNYCSVCGKQKSAVASMDNPSGEYDSHVFPEGILTLFRRIHCYNAPPSERRHEPVPSSYTEFIYDFVLDERFGTAAWTYQLLCSSCERKCSAAEEKLRHVYVQLMGQTDIKPVMFLNENYWFNYILAMIMFRGLLVNEKLSFNDSAFTERFSDLWNYCKTEPGPAVVNEVPLERKKENVIHDLRLFLLPNRAINTNFTTFLYSFEYSLRCPTFTRIVNNSENGRFFYWKFDCFHVVFPLDDNSRKYFNQFKNVLHEYHRGHLTLQWTSPQCVVTKTEISGAVKIIYGPKTTLIFPPALFEEGISLNNGLVEKMYHQASVPDFDSNQLPSGKVMTERYKGFGHQFPKLGCSSSGACILSSSQSDITKAQPIVFNKERDDKCIEEAATYSPLRLPERVAELERENKLLRTKLEALPNDDNAKNYVDMKYRAEIAEQELCKERKKNKEKQKKAGDMIVNLNKSLKNEEKALIKEKARSAREAKRAEENALKAEIAEGRILKLRNEIILEREIRITQKQQAENQLTQHDIIELQKAKTTLTMCMEFVPQPLKESCRETLESIDSRIGTIELRSKVISPHLGYLDLSQPVRTTSRVNNSITDVNRSLSNPA